MKGIDEDSRLFIKISKRTGGGASPVDLKG